MDIEVFVELGWGSLSWPGLAQYCTYRRDQLNTTDANHLWYDTMSIIYIQAVDYNYAKMFKFIACLFQLFAYYMMLVLVKTS